ncbi:MAG: bifunctional pyr operon transcriptional regulator/uracil phosphoribosyltransferase PyrR [Acidimicrobiia bacterium]|nr:bifunctional pyr operon transcriptional regulator/uracil phosphoribosyltransferase PyrR [Acidimicrobiia bacterium]
MDGDQIRRSLRRIAHEIIEQTHRNDDLVLLGILSRGAPLAHRLGKQMADLGSPVPVGTLDTGPFRDDLPTGSSVPDDHADVPVSVHERTVVLVDDVLATGRTIRAALDALVSLGRPRRVQVAVLVDRGHRELPIRADYVGKNVPTAPDEHVSVRLRESDEVDAVRIISTTDVSV